MTIPRLPGPLDALGQGFAAGLNAYDVERQRQYEQARSGLNTILNLIQTGRVDTAALADPSLSPTFQAAKTPQPSAQQVVPSVDAETARRFTQRAQGVAPGSTEESLMFKLPTYGDVTAEDLRQALLEVKQEAARNPAMARLLAEVLPGDIAEGLEAGQRAAITPKVYVDAAENFVAQAKGDAQKAKALAAADPQYAGLVANGQLSDEYFARAARAYSLLDEESRLAWGRIRAQQQQGERELRLYYNQILQGYDRDIGQMQAALRANELSMPDQVLAGDAAAKQSRGEPLDQLEKAALQKLQEVEAIKARLPEMIKERDEIRDRFILNRVPPIPDPRAPGARREARDAGVAPQNAAPTTPRLRQGPPRPASSTDLNRRTGESDADWWERLRQSGLSPAAATARVRGGR